MTTMETQGPGAREMGQANVLVSPDQNASMRMRQRPEQHRLNVFILSSKSDA